MSIYGAAVQKGISGIGLALTGSSAGTRAAYDQAYNETYQAATQRSNVRRARQASLSNISAIYQDKIMSNAKIRMNQDRAEANVILQAAVTGSAGVSVENAVYSTQQNEAWAVYAEDQKAEQGIESELASIENQSEVRLQQTEGTSIGDALMQGASNFELGDLRTSEAIRDGGLTKLWSN